MKPISVYLHWPFCEKKCPYCDFNSHVRSSIEESKWLNRMLLEIDFQANLINNNQYYLRSIFFGGGTPSLMPEFIVKELISKVKSIFQSNANTSKEPEITLEANPSSFEVSKFETFAKAGVNRVSIGVQSFDEEHLSFLGRVHNKNQAIFAIKEATKIFQKFSFDLIYARGKNHTLSQWSDELNFALTEFSPKHISLYLLTIEKGTQFFSLQKQGENLLPHNADDFYFLTNQIVKEYGFNQYEISNYSQPENECLHNLSYWKSYDFMGIGAGAHGRITLKNNKRTKTQNFSSPEKYLESPPQNLQTFEEMSDSEIFEEVIFSGLRMTNGIDVNEIKSNLNINIFDFLDKNKLLKLSQESLLIYNSNHIYATQKGLNILNSLISYIIF